MSKEWKAARDPLDRGLILVETLVVNLKNRGDYPGKWEDACEDLIQLLLNCHTAFGVALITLLIRYGGVHVDDFISKDDTRRSHLLGKYQNAIRSSVV